MKKIYKMIVVLLVLNFQVNCSGGNVDVQDTSGSENLIDNETLGEVSGLYNYRKEDESDRVCNYWQCETYTTANSSVIFIDSSANVLMCGTLGEVTLTTDYLYDQYSDSEYVVDEGTEFCKFGHYELVSSVDGVYNLQALIENTAFTEELYGTTDETVQFSVSGSGLTIEGLNYEMVKSAENVDSSDVTEYTSYLNDASILIRDATIFRLYSTQVMQLALVGDFYTDEISRSGFTSDSYVSVYSVIDSIYEGYPGYENADLFTYVSLNENGTYNGCSIVDDRIYAQSGDWQVVLEGYQQNIRFSASRYGYEDHPEEVSFDSEISQNDCDSDFCFSSYSNQNYEFYSENLYRTDAYDDFSLSSSQLSKITTCLDYLASDEQAPLVMTDSEYEANYQQEWASIYNEGLIDSYEANENSFAETLYYDLGETYEEDGEEYRLTFSHRYDAPTGTLSINDQNDFILNISYANQNYLLTGSISFEVSDYENLQDALDEQEYYDAMVQSTVTYNIENNTFPGDVNFYVFANQEYIYQIVFEFTGSVPDYGFSIDDTAIFNVD